MSSFLIRPAESAELEVRGGGIVLIPAPPHFYSFRLPRKHQIQLFSHFKKTLIIVVKMYEVLLFSSITQKMTSYVDKNSAFIFFEWGILKDNIDRKNFLEFPSNHEAILK